jgi:proteic killer suppression protein
LLDVYLLLFNCIYLANVLNSIVIIDFADSTTEDIYNGINSKAARKIPPSVWKVAARKLDMINSAHDLRDLSSLTGNRLEALRRDWSGYHAIRINDQYRIIFKWIDGNARNVLITDYH